MCGLVFSLEDVDPDAPAEPGVSPDPDLGALALQATGSGRIAHVTSRAQATSSWKKTKRN